MHICVCAYICVHIYVYIHIHVFVCIYIHMYVCMFVFICMYVCMYIYVCMYVCIYISTSIGLIKDPPSFPPHRDETVPRSVATSVTVLAQCTRWSTCWISRGRDWFWARGGPPILRWARSICMGTYYLSVYLHVEYGERRYWISRGRDWFWARDGPPTLRWALSNCRSIYRCILSTYISIETYIQR